MLETLPVQNYVWTKENIITHAKEFLKEEDASLYDICTRILLETTGATSFGSEIDDARFKQLISTEKSQIKELNKRIQAILSETDKSSEEFLVIEKIFKEAEEKFYYFTVVEKAIDEMKQRTFSKPSKIAELSSVVSFIGWITLSKNEYLESIGINDVKMFLTSVLTCAAFLMLAGLNECDKTDRINGCRQRIALLAKGIRAEKQPTV